MMGKDRPLPTPAVSKAGLKVKTQLLISNGERKQCVPTLHPPIPTHARTHTHPTPSSPKPWLGAGAPRPGLQGLPNSPETPGTPETRGRRALRPSSLPVPLPACPLPPPPPPRPPPRVYTGQPGPAARSGCPADGCAQQTRPLSDFC